MSPVGSGLGLYPYGEVADARENDEVSSTYEGRHLTVLGTEIATQMAGHALQQKGHQLLVGENIVGVAFNTEVAGGYVTFDTEGIWMLSVTSVGVAIVAGDELFIHKTNGILSNTYNKNTHAHFGYALGGVTVGGTAIISVKVHWDPDDALEQVGVSGTPEVSALDSKRFREYHYEAQGGGYPKGDYLALTVSTERCNGVQALRRELYLPGDADMSNSSYTGEFGLNISAGDAIQRTMACLKLNFVNLNSVSINNYACAYIQLSDASLTTMRMPRLLNFIDYAAPIDAGVDDDRIFVDSADLQPNSDLRIRCGYGPNATPFWIMCTTTLPT